MTWLLLWVLLFACVPQIHRAFAQDSSKMLSIPEPVAPEPYNHTQYCQWPCKCPKTPPTCPPALSSVKDNWHKNCVTQTTSWSPCSKTCGRGVSLRITNNNKQCQMVKESRLCNIRPCKVDITKHIKPGKKCLNIYRDEKPHNFTISGCTSTNTYRPKYCGVCTDERCCIPYKSKTVEVDFQCPNGSGFTWQVMWINACFCNLSCKNPNDIFTDLEQYHERGEIGN
ncbi:WNT1-inducible-signaling pathway 1-like protein [Labeo rohita]|uniref:CCN family member 3 n=1 Tax=Labeo rohita TaxID=84645 RepID=A0A498MZ38_LABRO|nr:WNT1-inducible-signaling pathway 1-like protein [Labeo rohita]